MTDTFFSRDPEKFSTELVDQLYKRLDDVRRALGVRVALDDEFDQGINCRASNEEAWLEDLLTQIEKTR